MLEWFQLFNADGVCVYEMLEYTATGALKYTPQYGITDAVTARRLHPYAHITD